MSRWDWRDGNGDSTPLSRFMGMEIEKMADAYNPAATIGVIKAQPRQHLVFTVRGVPAPQGSKRIGRNRATGAPVLLNDNDKPLKAWRQAVSSAASAAAGDRPPFDCPVAVNVVFTFERPKGHYGTGRNAFVVKDSAPEFPAVKPDIDKLVRAVLDALTQAAVFFDDSRVVILTATKAYGTPGLRCSVRPITSQEATP